MPVPPPPPPKSEYNRSKTGYVGELGSGSFARIKFLQSAVTASELDSISLIETIRGSEKWSVQNLFQRDVDQQRVQESILPYLKSEDKIKFFSPLTLVLLPIKTNGDPDTEVSYISEVMIEEHGSQYGMLDWKGKFQYRINKDEPAYSKLLWNDQRVKLVAIDGQHRLSALKSWNKELGEKSLDNWQIPVVILGIFRADNEPEHKPPTLLEVIRTTFVYINTRAEEINEARRILLDDEEVEAVCTQELVQASHKNDCSEPGALDQRKIPLMLIDWRGQMKWEESSGTSRDVSAPGSLLSIVEIYQWMKEYIFEAIEPKIALNFADLHPPLTDTYFESFKLSHTDAAQVRRQFQSIVAPGLSHLLENFVPFERYIKSVRGLERDKQKVPFHPFAFQRLRFGRDNPSLTPAEVNGANAAYADIVKELERQRSAHLDALIDHTIGMRAVMHSFAELYKYRDSQSKTTLCWKKHAEWFVPKLNQVYQQGWFKSFSTQSADIKKRLTHVCFDSAGEIINYKVNDVRKAFGAMVALLIVRQAIKDFPDAATQEELWRIFEDGLESTLKKGYRRQVRSALSLTFKGTAAQLTKQVNIDANTKVAKRIAELQKFVFHS
jgi:hypothetical protein